MWMIKRMKIFRRKEEETQEKGEGEEGQKEDTTSRFKLQRKSLQE